MAEEEALVIQKFNELVRLSPEMNEAVVAIRALTEVLKLSPATTMMEVQKELEQASEQLRNNNESSSRVLSLTSGCELFTRFVTRTFLDIPDFDKCKKALIERGEKFTHMTVTARNRISRHAEHFIHDGNTLLVHGESRVVASVLQYVITRNKRFRVLVTESRPDNAGYNMIATLNKMGIPTTLIMDSAVSHYLHKVDAVLVGAEAVVENGGIVNKIGTFQIAIVARAFNIPFYVLAESYKFTRIYPLNQQDLPASSLVNYPLTPLKDMPDNSKYLNSMSDYTPPQFIRLLFTDLGVLTPSAVSDELIKLYN